MIFKKEINSLTGMLNIDFDSFDPLREDSQTICPSGKFHALNILPSEERVMTSAKFKCTLVNSIIVNTQFWTIIFFFLFLFLNF